MTSEYNLPLPVSAQNGDPYAMDDGYPQNGSPGMSWDGQTDGGGKFRLKRRRRCGQCAPCQVKENCNKCQYCMRKDVLKQACIYRKCVYLRKPVPRFRQEATPTQTSSNNGSSNPKSSISSSRKGTQNSNAQPGSTGSTPVNGSSTGTPVSNVSPPTTNTVTPANNPELSSCRLNQSPFTALSAMPAVGGTVLDPLRHHQRVIEHQHRSSLFETMSHHPVLGDPAHKSSITDVSRYPGPIGVGPGQSVNSAHCKIDQPSSAVSHASEKNSAVAAAAAAASSPLNSMSSSLSSNHNHYQSGKAGMASARESYFSSMDAWSSMSYSLPRPPTWPSSALTNPHAAAAAAYSFQQHANPFQSSFAPSSCRLGIQDSAASRFSSPAAPQPSFHHGMASFSQDLSHSASNHTNHPGNLHPAVAMNPPFYPPPHHIPPSSIPSFSSLGQFPSAQPSFQPSPYSGYPHSHLYPGGFYSSYRAPTEPQIYHSTVHAHKNPFQEALDTPVPNFYDLENKSCLSSSAICKKNELHILPTKNIPWYNHIVRSIEELYKISRENIPNKNKTSCKNIDKICNS